MTHDDVPKPCLSRSWTDRLSCTLPQGHPGPHTNRITTSHRQVEWFDNPSTQTDARVGRHTVDSITSDDLDQLYATIQRLNHRAQRTESELATYRRAVAQWEISDRGTYIPLSSLRTIGKVCGVDILGSARHLKHFERVEQAEAALDQLYDRLDAVERSVKEAREGQATLGSDVVFWAALAERHQKWGQRRWNAWKSARARAQQQQAALERVRDLAEDIRRGAPWTANRIHNAINQTGA